ncbi:MAG: TonB family protein [Pyrinomonadaceae bacterium]|nr:TonB family protein [Pyrinomonadaceae bacterium]
MRRISLMGHAIGILVSVLAVNSFGQTFPPEIGCNLERFDPAIVSHALLYSVRKRVQPTYPLAARSVNAHGAVAVQIVVNRSGRVVGVCAIAGHPLLRRSAEDAAKQWRFKKNFGYKYRQKRKYILSSITFRFVLPGY